MEGESAELLGCGRAFVGALVRHLPRAAARQCDTMGRAMENPGPISLEEFRQLVEMLRTTITGMSDLADRVKALEDSNNQSLAAAVALKENQQQLYEAYQAQQKLN